jgi:hypothetical protein
MSDSILSKYGLRFYKLRIDPSFSLLSCCSAQDKIYGTLACHLNTFQVCECEHALEELENAEQGRYHDSVNNDATKVQFELPQAIIDNYFEIPAADLKEIYREWIMFCEN